ncbi:type I restriction-modification system subunit M N-terminal domain-containing protein [Providencia stuartii]|uniref:type I restriction-modification system subunit M N-terminal domain-containing protein n=1 Tax=Providencia stuartii TaxID=588 RepID=UPI00300D84EA
MTTANDAQQLRELQGKLWDIADSLRGKMHADEFRDYCLGFIFYKYLSEQFANYADHILKQDGLTTLLSEKAITVFIRRPCPIIGFEYPDN